MGAKLAGEFQAEQQSPVLGHVVRGIPEVGAPLHEGVTVGRAGHRGGGGRTGIAPRAAVHVDHDLVQARAQELLGGSIGGKEPLARWRRRSVYAAWLPGSPPWARRSMITVTLGSSS